MAYLEWLRIKRVMFWVGIFLAVTFLIAVVLRVTLGGINQNFHFDRNSKTTVSVTYSNGQKHTVTKIVPDIQRKETRTLPDGSKQIIRINTDGTTVVKTDHGYFGGYDIDIVEPLHGNVARHNGQSNMMMFTNSQVTAPFDVNGYHFNVTKPMSYVKIRTASGIPLWVFLIGASITAMIVATILGISFAAQNDGHLEIAFTRPASREVEALRAIGIDIAGILLIMAIQGIIGVIAFALWIFPHVTLGADDLRVVALEVAVPIAWYAFTLAATSSLKRGYGALAGILWPVSIAIMAFATQAINGSQIAQFIYQTAGVLERFIPFYYGNVHQDSSGAAMMTIDSVIPDLNVRLLILAALIIGYSAISIVQWRRVEA
ncbi:MAG: hypothetical protein ACYDA1_06425 [Vulcanimicrobiaceae bacterium]